VVAGVRVRGSLPDEPEVRAVFDRVVTMRLTDLHEKRQAPAPARRDPLARDTARMTREYLALVGRLARSVRDRRRIPVCRSRERLILVADVPCSKVSVRSPRGCRFGVGPHHLFGESIGLAESPARSPGGSRAAPPSLSSCPSLAGRRPERAVRSACTKLAAHARRRSLRRVGRCPPAAPRPDDCGLPHTETKPDGVAA